MQYYEGQQTFKFEFHKRINRSIHSAFVCEIFSCAFGVIFQSLGEVSCFFSLFVVPVDVGEFLFLVNRIKIKQT